MIINLTIIKKEDAERLSNWEIIQYFMWQSFLLKTEICRIELMDEVIDVPC